MVMTPEVRTERLLMRGWREEDKLPFSLLTSDPEVMRHFPSMLSAQQSDEMVDGINRFWSGHGYGLWAVDRLDTHAFIGFVGLWTPSWSERPYVEVGWRLAHQHWGHGFAPEAARAALQFGFEHVHLPDDEIVSFTTTLNLNSQRVMEKIGMQHDPARDFDHPLLPTWDEKRHVLYRIDRRMWQAGVAR